ncbi:hypothetical protein H4R20_004618 [Coemansia guatemalensis]|uniref:SH3 domain-containing protein n=1 Tax=Coemansia guatemalensis TaxID=2761395 RepID=A0A9W8LQC5_9FUNG|nr:hypothetical protein H4R20_004618 [Coemansia guatemalensis]
MYTLANRLLLVLVSALLAHTSLTHAACLSLRDSQGCPGFSKEFISTNATSRFSWYPKDDISAFDRALSDYVVGQANLDEFQSVFRCGGLDDLGGFTSDHGISVIRYHRSMVCADIIFSEANIGECYGDRAAEHRRRDLADETAEMQVAEILASSTVNVRPSQPMPLCRSTCESWIDSLHSITTNSTLCKPDKGINRSASLESLRKKCNLNMYNGTSDRCVDGDANELKTCGYQRVEDWCKYCDYASDYADVCQSVGVEIKGDRSDNGDKGKLGVPTHTSHHRPDSDNSLSEELEQQKRQERAFRVVAIVLSIAVGVCIISLIALISMGRRQHSASAYNIYGNASNSGSGSGRDDSTLLHLGANGTVDPEKAPDFVDCFVAAVGKPRQVVRPFFARRDDEISLQCGDKVTLQMAFDDGWVVGKNLTSGYEGTFPLMCVMENLPPSLPAQWSVLPESKNASIENLRNSSRSGQRPSPRSLMPGSRPTTGEFGNGASNATTPSAPLITTTAIPSSSNLQSTRTSLSHAQQRGNEAVEEPSRENKGKGILDRLIGAFSPTGATGDVSPTNDNETSGFFKRLVASPFGARDKARTPEISRPKSGRPHSFNVHHVVHVGLDNPNFPQPHADQNASISTAPSSVQSVNRYPIMTGQNSAGRNPNTPPPTAPVNPRNSNLSYGEFVSANSSQATTAGNQSTETYRTAEQSAFGGSGAPLATAPRAAYLR